MSDTQAAIARNFLRELQNQDDELAALREQLSLANGTIESRDRNISELLGENERLKAESRSHELNANMYLEWKEAAEKQLAEAKREIKNLAPTGRYNGLDIEAWYLECKKATERVEAAERQLEVQITANVEQGNRCREYLAEAEADARRLDWFMGQCIDKLGITDANTPAEYRAAIDAAIKEGK